MKSAANKKRWVDVDAEIVAETPKAVLLDFGADKGTTHQAWVPKSQFQEVENGNFRVQRITAWWMSREGLWKWL